MQAALNSRDGVSAAAEASGRLDAHGTPERKNGTWRVPPVGDPGYVVFGECVFYSLYRVRIPQTMTRLTTRALVLIILSR